MQVVRVYQINFTYTQEQKKQGVITASAGNHALALAYYGMKLGVPVTVVLPTTAPQVKVSILCNDIHMSNEAYI